MLSKTHLQKEKGDYPMSVPNFTISFPALGPGEASILSQKLTVWMTDAIQNESVNKDDHSVSLNDLFRVSRQQGDEMAQGGLVEVALEGLAHGIGTGIFVATGHIGAEVITKKVYHLIETWKKENGNPETTIRND